jgi:hypothetical protein
VLRLVGVLRVVPSSIGTGRRGWGGDGGGGDADSAASPRLKTRIASGKGTKPGEQAAGGGCPQYRCLPLHNDEGSAGARAPATAPLETIRRSRWPR